MSTKSVELPRPTTDLVASYVETFNQKQTVVENALTKLFTLFPENTELEHVLIKVVALNDLYRTGILATFQVAEHIFRLNIDRTIKEGKPEAVELIGHIHLGESTRNNYSFATKYCAWHNPEAYPMYDSFVDQMLWGYKQQDLFDKFYRKDLWVYNRFKEIAKRFREHYNLSAFTIKDIDKFLWLAGKKYYPAPWETQP